MLEYDGPNNGKFRLHAQIVKGDVLPVGCARTYRGLRHEGYEARTALYQARMATWQAPDTIAGFDVDITTEPDGEGMDWGDIEVLSLDEYRAIASLRGMSRSDAYRWAELTLLRDSADIDDGETTVCGVIVTLSDHGHEMGQASVWNVVDDYRGAYVHEIAQELIDEALHEANKARAAIVARDIMARA